MVLCQIFKILNVNPTVSLKNPVSVELCKMYLLSKSEIRRLINPMWRHGASQPNCDLRGMFWNYFQNKQS